MCCVCQYGEDTTNIENANIQLTETKWQMVFTYVQMLATDNKWQQMSGTNVSNWQQLTKIRQHLTYDAMTQLNRQK